jgi:hypothetical protein
MKAVRAMFAADDDKMGLRQEFADNKAGLEREKEDVKARYDQELARRLSQELARRLSQELADAKTRPGVEKTEAEARLATAAGRKMRLKRGLLVSTMVAGVVIE